MDVDSGEGLIDGFLKCSSKMPGGIDCLEDPNLDNCIGCIILSPGNMPELTSFKVATYLLHQEMIGRHICIMCIPYAGALLDHHIRITEAHNPANAYVLGHFQAMHKCLIFRHIVRCCKVDLQNISQLVILG
jgi:hypothetical protein